MNAAEQKYTKGGEVVCKLNCRWFDMQRWRQIVLGNAPNNPEDCCTSALAAFEDNGHCPCHEHIEEPSS